MQLIRTDAFKRDYERLPVELQQRLEQKLELFLQNPLHPSLRVEKMRGKWGIQGVREASFTEGYRFTFKWEGDLCSLRRCGPHDVLETP